MTGFDFSALAAAGYQQFDFTSLARPAARVRPPRVLDSRTGQPVGYAGRRGFQGFSGRTGRQVSAEYKLAAYRRFELERDRLHARFDGPAVTDTVTASFEPPVPPPGKSCNWW